MQESRYSLSQIEACYSFKKTILFSSWKHPQTLLRNVIDLKGLHVPQKLV